MRFLASTLWVLVLACGPMEGSPRPETDTPATPEESGETEAALSIASIPFASTSERQARLRSVHARLGPAWMLTWYSAEQLHPSSGYIHNPSGRGNKTSGEAESIAQAFLLANGDLFGLTSKDLQSMSFSLEWVDNRFWRYAGRGLRTTSGYEAFPGFHRTVRATVEIWSDGTVIGVSVGGQELPALQMNKQPALSDVSPLVRGKVIGHEVVAIENPPGAYVSGPTRLIGRGPVLAADITGVRLDVWLQHNSPMQRTDLSLVYVFEVTKFEGNTFTFWVDANTGALIGAQDSASSFVTPGVTP